MKTLIQLLALSFVASPFTLHASDNLAVSSEDSAIKQNLSLLGFANDWTKTDNGEMQILESGGIYLDEQDYSAILTLNQMSETTLQASLMQGITLCTKLGMAVTGQQSSPTFKAFGSLTKQALSQPNAPATGSYSPFEYRVVITGEIDTQASFQCGIKRL
ncbi:hypothetical protein [Enterovibrio coralii]|uniref:Uncharacterized protein n=1 Tax=Enterovibrio coralii TaxID=294935 RepID=A0A135I8E9_9GAMM|nr:hypothetical protein [Enterovibrio coralii]KXF81729.1 hypothetical protein ATN88_03530 [Enterovibrio coralii]